MRSRALRLVLALSLPYTALTSAQQATRAELTDADASVEARLQLRSLGEVTSSASTGATIGQHPGWPLVVGGDLTFAPTRGLAFADLDGDARLDILVSSTDSKLYAFDLSGANKPGFPVNLIGDAQTAPTVADLDGDGDLEIVQFTRGLTAGGRVYVLDEQGVALPGWPKSVGGNNLGGTPCVQDLDGDGMLEILVPERAYPLGLLHVFELDGSEWGGNWPTALDHVPTGTPAVADLDQDGVLEIVYLSYQSLYVWDVSGTLEPGWPLQIAGSNFSYQSPALGDLDGDGDLEVVVATHQTTAGLYVFHHDGSPAGGWPKLFGTWSFTPPTLVDVDDDGALDVIAGRDGGFSGNSSVFWVWDGAGNVRPGFPYVSSNGGGSGGPFTVLDLDGDGRLELFCDHNVQVGTQGFLFGVDADGNDLAGFPLRPEGFTYLNGAMIADIEGDGDYDLGVLSFHDADVEVNLYDLGGLHHPKDVRWSTYHGSDARGGLVGSGDALVLRGSATLQGGLRLQLAGAAGEVAFLALNVAPGLTAVPPYGYFRVALVPPPVFLLAGAPFPADGRIDAAFRLPNDASLLGLDLFLQGLTSTSFPATGSFTNAVRIRIR